MRINFSYSSLEQIEEGIRRLALVIGEALEQAAPNRPGLAGCRLGPAVSGPRAYMELRPSISPPQGPRPASSHGTIRGPCRTLRLFHIFLQFGCLKDQFIAIFISERSPQTGSKPHGHSRALA
jgi:hypothetical protein